MAYIIAINNRIVVTSNNVPGTGEFRRQLDVVARLLRWMPEDIFILGECQGFSPHPDGGNAHIAFQPNAVEWLVNSPRAGRIVADTYRELQAYSWTASLVRAGVPVQFSQTCENGGEPESKPWDLEEINNHLEKAQFKFSDAVTGWMHLARFFVTAFEATELLAEIISGVSAPAPAVITKAGADEVGIPAKEVC